jgi:hypothetical protein
MRAYAPLAALWLTPLLLTACGKGSGASSSSTPATAVALANASATTTAPARATGGTCSFAGDWTGNLPPGPYPFSGKPFDFVFNADGTGITDSWRATPAVAWKSEGGTFSIRDINDVRRSPYTCRESEVGEFGFTFVPDCTTVTLTLQQDPCKGRAKALDGLSMKRR